MNNYASGEKPEVGDRVIRHPDYFLYNPWSSDLEKIFEVAHVQNSFITIYDDKTNRNWYPQQETMLLIERNGKKTKWHPEYKKCECHSPGGQIMKKINDTTSECPKCGGVKHRPSYKEGEEK